MILPMAGLQILGPRRQLADVVAFLQARGVLELRECPGERPAPPPDAPALDAALQRIDALLARVPPVAPATAAPPLPPPASGTFGAAVEAIEQRLSDVSSRRGALRAEATEAARLSRLLAALAPLRAAARLPVRAREIGLSLRRDRPEALPLLEREVARITGGAYDLRSAPAGDDLAVLLSVPAARGPALSALLSQHGAAEVTLPGAAAGLGPARGAAALEARRREIPAALASLDAEERELAATARRQLEDARRAARTRRAQLDALARCAETGHAFVLAGWAPRRDLPALGAALAAAFGSRVVVVEREVSEGEAGDVPVVLSNPPLLRPFERLLALAPLPRYGSDDPTAWLAFFYPFLFGLVLADLGFAVLAAAAALLARARGWGGALGRDVAAIALACAGWAGLFGLLFGELFGEWGARLGVHPLVLDRRHALLAFLALALAVGAVHLAVGLALGVRAALRDREWRLAIARASRLALLGAAAVAAASPAARGAALAAVVALALVGVLAEGPLALLDAVLTAGNVLSYARLMALGAASLLLAEAANGLGAALPGAAGAAAAVLLHAVNFTLGLVSPAIAALRLQYVEFFEKFYREGGHPFRPLALTE